jgi:hypothetical protein
LNAALGKYGRELDEDGLGYVLGEVFACSGALLGGMGIEGLKTDFFGNVVAERHAKVSEIIAKHIKAIKDEILALDPETLNIDGAGDMAEVARQVLDALVEQLRGFSRGARSDIAEEREGLFGHDETTDNPRHH